MPSGKQVSFQYGEVSPALRFRSDSVSYAEGLSKLKNKFVRNAGGVSNRPGFIFIQAHPYQDEQMVEGGEPGIKGFAFTNPSTAQTQILEYYYNTSKYSFFLNIGSEVPVFSFGQGISGTKPSKIRFAPLKDEILILPRLEIEPPNLSYPEGANPCFDYATSTIVPFGFYTAPSITVGFKGSTVFGTGVYTPVSYIFTGVFKDGTERTLATYQTPNGASGTTHLWYPYDGLFNTIRLDFVTPYADMKYISVYRSFGGANEAAKFYKFTQRLNYDGAAVQVQFIDFGAEQVSINPPIDLRLLGDAQTQLTGAKTAGYYQQRLILAYDKDTEFKPGELGASKIGAPRQIGMPAVFRDAEAFEFSVPVTDSSPVTAMLPMERLIVFTEQSTYVCRGGEQGVFTPTSINPVLLSEVGCSAIVEPKMKGSRGYFLNFDHTKLMGIEFGDDGNLKVFNVSVLADHLLAEDVHTMEIVEGKESIVYLLRRDGKMIQITVGDAFSGFSIVETDGFIENIFTNRSLKLYMPNVPTSSAAADRLDPPYASLYAYVIRDGVRNLEVLAYREDVLPEGMVYSDSCSVFGERLAKKPDGSWRRLTGSLSPVAVYAEGVKMNIIGGTTWAAGETVTVEYTGSFVGAGGLKLNFYYEDSDGVIQKIAFEAAGLGTQSTVGYTQAYEGTFDKDIPAELQDVESQSLTASEKLNLTTRWIAASNSVTGLTHLANKDVSVFAEGELLSSPNNPIAETLTVSAGGVLTLPDYYSWGVVGLPYTSEFESLDVESSEARTLTDARKIINAVGIAFYETKGGYAGIENATIDNMAPVVPTNEDDIDDVTGNFTGHIQVPIPTMWSEKGRVNIKQVDPLPMTILSIYPKGVAGD